MTDSLSVAPDGRLTALTVRLGRNLHAIPVEAVVEVLPALPVEPVPHAPPFVHGVVFVRGRLIPVLDGANRLGVDDYERPLEPQIVCVRARGRLVGVEVDEAIDLVHIDGAQVMPAREFAAEGGPLIGIVEHEESVLRVLDVERLVESAEATELSRLPETAARRQQ